MSSRLSGNTGVTSSQTMISCRCSGQKTNQIAPNKFERKRCEKDLTGNKSYVHPTSNQSLPGNALAGVTSWNLSPEEGQSECSITFVILVQLISSRKCASGFNNREIWHIIIFILDLAWDLVGQPVWVRKVEVLRLR